MGALFVSASTQYFLNTTPSKMLTTLPLTVGCWCKMYATTGAGQNPVSFGDGTANSAYALAHNGTPAPVLLTTQGGTPTQLILSGTGFAAGLWEFMVGRWSSATARSLNVYLPNTGFFSTSAGTSITATTITQMAIGTNYTNVAAQPFNGVVSEVWACDADIYPSDTTTIPVPLMLQLALGGPFSVPSVAARVREYISLRNWIPPMPQGAPLTEQFEWNPGGVLPNWTPTNGPILGEHPPLPYWYRRAGIESANLMVIGAQSGPPARVQGAGNHNNTGTTCAATAAATVASGNAVVGVVSYASSTPFVSITDDKGNTYNVETEITDSTNAQKARAFSLGNITNAPKIITLTVSGSSGFSNSVAWDEYSGIRASQDPRDSTAHGGQLQPTPGTGSNAVLSGSFTTTADGDLVVGLYAGTAGQNPTITAGTTSLTYTNATGDNGTPNTAKLQTEYAIQTTAGSGTQASFTQSVAGATICSLVALKRA